MLRITKKEKQELYRLNSRIRRKIKNLKSTFNIDRNFEITTPKQFLTRMEVNLYKRQAKEFLNPYRDGIVKLGTKRGSKYYFYVSREEYRELKNLVQRQNRYAYNLMRKQQQIPLTEGGKNQAISAGAFIQTTAPQTRQEGLRSRHQQFFPIKIDKESIHDYESFKNFKEALTKFHTTKSYKNINEQAQRNFITALENTFGVLANPLSLLIAQLSPQEFIEFYESDVFVDFDYIYSPERVMEVLGDVSRAILQWFANSLEFTKRKYVTEEFLDVTNEIKKLAEIDSAVILSNLNMNVENFKDPATGKRYVGVYRQREVEQIRSGNITQAILRKAKEVRYK